MELGENLTELVTQNVIKIANSLKHNFKDLGDAEAINLAIDIFYAKNEIFKSAEGLSINRLDALKNSIR